MLSGWRWGGRKETILCFNSFLTRSRLISETFFIKSSAGWWHAEGVVVERCAIYLWRKTNPSPSICHLTAFPTATGCYFAACVFKASGEEPILHITSPQSRRVFGFISRKKRSASLLVDGADEWRHGWGWGDWGWSQIILAATWNPSREVCSPNLPTFSPQVTSPTHPSHSPFSLFFLL